MSQRKVAPMPVGRTDGKPQNIRSEPALKVTNMDDGDDDDDEYGDGYDAFGDDEDAPNKKSTAQQQGKPDTIINTAELGDDDASGSPSSQKKILADLKLKMTQGVKKIFRKKKVENDDLAWDWKGFRDGNVHKINAILRGWFLSFDNDGSRNLEQEELERMLTDASDFNEVAICAVLRDLADKKASQAHSKTSFKEFEQTMAGVMGEIFNESWKNLASKLPTEENKEKRRQRETLSRWLYVLDGKDGWIQNYTIMGLALIIQALIFIPAVWVSFGAWYGVSLCLFLPPVLYVSGVFAPRKFVKEASHALSRLGQHEHLNPQKDHGKKRNGPILIGIALTSSLAIAMVYGYWALLGYPPLRYSDVRLPLYTHGVCFVGIACITLWQVSRNAQLACKRDLNLLKSYPIRSPVYAHSNPTANHLFRIIRKRATFIIEQENDDARKLSLVNLIGLAWKFGRHLLGATIIPVFAWVLPYIPVLASFAFSVSDLQDSATNVSIIGSADDDWLGYSYASIPGIVLTIASTLLFEKIIQTTTLAPFERSHKILRLLLTTTSAPDSAHYNVPYCPLYSIKNLQAFLRIQEFFREHYLGTMLGEASSGFAGLLLVDVVVITSLVVMIYRNDRNLRTMITLGFYSMFVTSWCFVLLFQAVKINSVHRDILSRLWQLQAEVTVSNIDDEIDVDTDEEEANKDMFYRNTKQDIKKAKEDEEDDGIVGKIDQVRQSIENNYRPVTILGIPATPTLLNVFIGYLVSALIAVLWNRLGLD